MRNAEHFSEIARDIITTQCAESGPLWRVSRVSVDHFAPGFGAMAKLHAVLLLLALACASHAAELLIQARMVLGLGVGRPWDPPWGVPGVGGEPPPHAEGAEDFVQPAASGRPIEPARGGAPLQGGTVVNADYSAKADVLIRDDKIVEVRPNIEVRRGELLGSADVRSRWGLLVQGDAVLCVGWETPTPLLARGFPNVRLHTIEPPHPPPTPRKNSAGAWRGGGECGRQAGHARRHRPPHPPCHALHGPDDLRRFHQVCSPRGFGHFCFVFCLFWGGRGEEEREGRSDGGRDCVCAEGVRGEGNGTLA